VQVLEPRIRHCLRGLSPLVKAVGQLLARIRSEKHNLMQFLINTADALFRLERPAPLIPLTQRGSADGVSLPGLGATSARRLPWLAAGSIPQQSSRVTSPVKQLVQRTGASTDTPARRLRLERFAMRGQPGTVAAISGYLTLLRRWPLPEHGPHPMSLWSRRYAARCLRLSILPATCAWA